MIRLNANRQARHFGTRQLGSFCVIRGACVGCEARALLSNLMGAFFWALFPAFLSAVYLTTDGEVSVGIRNAVLGSLGGAIGVVAAILLGYVIGGFRAEGQITKAIPEQG